ncbi:unnamed protein product [Pleuronectes platessa]|uniref:Uncharacterized protein n=1 Tax=Pleuronectes platessa TaxID=8262 RepID=A0A9N7UBK4_PLEPL|nr:unnamed protein product [Pleuronectes platessa]
MWSSRCRRLQFRGPGVCENHQRHERREVSSSTASSSHIMVSARRVRRRHPGNIQKNRSAFTVSPDQINDQGARPKQIPSSQNAALVSRLQSPCRSGAIELD